MRIDLNAQIGDLVTEDIGAIRLTHKVIGKDSDGRFITELVSEGRVEEKPVVEVKPEEKPVVEVKPEEKKTVSVSTPAPAKMKASATPAKKPVKKK